MDMRGDVEPYVQGMEGERTSHGVRDAVEFSARRPTPGPAFHYVTQAVTTLEHVAERLPAAARVRLTARGRRISVVSVRLTERGGRTVHAKPTATAEALYLDYRDLAALEAGGAVPELDLALEAMLGDG